MKQNEQPKQKRVINPCCVLCGEELTAPIEYKGAFYGWSCIKRVNPSAKKTKVKSIWVKADSFEINEIESVSNTHKIIAKYNGKGYLDFWNEKYTHSHAIIIQSGIAFIDAMKYERLLKQINTSPTF